MIADKVLNVYTLKWRKHVWTMVCVECFNCILSPPPPPKKSIPIHKLESICIVRLRLNRTTCMFFEREKKWLLKGFRSANRARWLSVCWSQLLVRVAAYCSHYNCHVTLFIAAYVPWELVTASQWEADERTGQCVTVLLKRGPVIRSRHVKMLRFKFRTKPSLTIPSEIHQPLKPRYAGPICLPTGPVLTALVMRRNCAVL